MICSPWRISARPSTAAKVENPWFWFRMETILGIPHSRVLRRIWHPLLTMTVLALALDQFGDTKFCWNQRIWIVSFISAKWLILIDDSAKRQHHDTDMEENWKHCAWVLPRPGREPCSKHLALSSSSSRLANDAGWDLSALACIDHTLVWDKGFAVDQC